MIQKGTEGVYRVGYVSDYDAKRHMARVIFPAMDGLISGWLPVIVSCSNGNYSESHLDIGTHAACLMAGEGVESGIILGTFYDNTNKPREGNPDITRLEFSDGTSLAYNRESHTLNVSAAGDIIISAKGNIILNGSQIMLN